MGEDKHLSHYFIFVIKNKNKDTHNIEIKQSSALFSGTLGVFSRVFKKLNEQIYK